MKLVHNLLETNKTATKRDIFYTNVPLFQLQEKSDKIIDDIACHFKVPRFNLHIVFQKIPNFQGCFL